MQYHSILVISANIFQEVSFSFYFLPKFIDARIWLRLYLDYIKEGNSNMFYNEKAEHFVIHFYPFISMVAINKKKINLLPPSNVSTLFPVSEAWELALIKKGVGSCLLDELILILYYFYRLRKTGS